MPSTATGSAHSRPARQLIFATTLCCVLAAAPSAAQRPEAPTAALALTPGTPLALRNARAIWLEYRGRHAMRLAPLEGHERDSDQQLEAVLTGSEFHDGTIAVDVAGARRAGYATDNASAYKGFVGITFRQRGDTAERFYIRPENARLDDQLFRNRSVQYESPPDYPWPRLRREDPGAYESYADMEAGGWTALRIVVSGRTARIYINGAPQPVLVVNDLKQGDSHGAVALWARISSDAYFSNLHVTPARRASDVEPPSTGEPLAPGTATTPGVLPSFTQVLNGRFEQVEYHGVPALHLIPAHGARDRDDAMLAFVDGPPFKDGTIELSLAGAPRADAPPDSRGFIGVSVRTGAHGEWSEVFYLRPTNARADDQLRRNHTLQYVSHPGFPWNRLRAESPGVYESYADMQGGEWTTLKVVVAGTTARLYINGAAQPALVVTDLKHGDGAGSIALWAHVQTEAYFGALAVTRR